jgi:hypothetical protein
MGNLKTGFWVTLGVMLALLVIGLVMGVFTK